jgi:hypothetical protein
MIIIRSSYEPTSATVGQAATPHRLKPLSYAVSHVGRKRRRDAQAE